MIPFTYSNVQSSIEIVIPNNDFLNKGVSREILDDEFETLKTLPSKQDGGDRLESIMLELLGSEHLRGVNASSIQNIGSQAVF
jgi:hypothetical protein